MSKVTREEWDKISKARIAAMMFGGRIKPEVAMRHAQETMEQDYGPRPEAQPEKPKAPEPPWWMRLGLAALNRKLKGAKTMNPMLQRFLTSAGYAAVITYGSIQASGMPQTVEGWFILAGVLAGAFWAKFSTSTRVVAMDRKPWTEAEKKQAALDEINKGL